MLGPAISHHGHLWVASNGDGKEKPDKGSSRLVHQKGTNGEVIHTQKVANTEKHHTRSQEIIYKIHPLCH